MCRTLLSRQVSVSYCFPVQVDTTAARMASTMACVVRLSAWVHSSSAVFPARSAACTARASYTKPSERG